MTTARWDSESGGSPTVPRILLGSELRRLRDSKGISRDAAGYAIRASDSKISRLELGRVGFKERDVADLLTLYGVTDEQERSALLAMAREANTPGWWHGYGDILPNWFSPYLGLEVSAALIRTYEVQFVPGLLQTRDYARTVVLQEFASASAEEIERRTNLRMERQRNITRPDAPMLWAVVDEAALRRPVGGPAVMRAQIQALIEATKRPNIRLQIVPFHAGLVAAGGGGFVILRFPDEQLPDIVYIEHLTGGLYLDKPEEVDRYGKAMERLCVDAEPPGRTQEFLSRVLLDFGGAEQ